MANTKKPTHTVVHPRLFLRVNDKLEHVEAGTPIVLNKAQADRLGGKVAKVGTKKTVDATDE